MTWPDAAAALPAVLSPDIYWDRDTITEMYSPCADFRVIVVRICGKQLYEAYRVSGSGTLYSATTTDPGELHALLLEACLGDCRR